MVVSTPPQLSLLPLRHYTALPIFEAVRLNLPRTEPLRKPDCFYQTVRKFHYACTRLPEPSRQFLFAHHASRAFMRSALALYFERRRDVITSADFARVMHEAATLDQALRPVYRGDDLIDIAAALQARHRGSEACVDAAARRSVLEELARVPSVREIAVVKRRAQAHQTLYRIMTGEGTQFFASARLFLLGSDLSDKVQRRFSRTLQRAANRMPRDSSLVDNRLYLSLFDREGVFFDHPPGVIGIFQEWAAEFPGGLGIDNIHMRLHGPDGLPVGDAVVEDLMEHDSDSHESASGSGTG